MNPREFLFSIVLPILLGIGTNLITPRVSKAFNDISKNYEKKKVRKILDRWFHVVYHNANKERVRWIFLSSLNHISLWGIVLLVVITCSLHGYNHYGILTFVGSYAMGNLAGCWHENHHMIMDILQERRRIDKCVQELRDCGFSEDKIEQIRGLINEQFINQTN